MALTQLFNTQHANIHPQPWAAYSSWSWVEWVQCLVQKCYASACRQPLSCLPTSYSSGLKCDYLSWSGPGSYDVAARQYAFFGLTYFRHTLWHPCNIQQAMSSVNNGLPAFLMIATASLTTAFLSWHISSYLLLCRGSLHPHTLHPPTSTYVLSVAQGHLSLLSAVTTFQPHIQLRSLAIGP